jgi:hypothetical protein
MRPPATLRGDGASPPPRRDRARAERQRRPQQGGGGSAAQGPSRRYAVGHPRVPVEGRWLAAVLACGPSVALSHRAAAALRGLLPTARARTDVTVRAAKRGSRPGIEVHAGGTLRPADVTRVDGVPCTTVARTLLDLSEVVDDHTLARACERAESLRSFDMLALDDVLVHAGGRRGAPRLRAVIARLGGDPRITRSELEERFLALCGAAGVPAPRVNAWIDLPGGAIEVDFAWPAQQLVVETDGHEAHGTRLAFERDRERDRRLVLAGWRVVRFTWRQVAAAPKEVASTLRALLSA